MSHYTSYPSSTIADMSSYVAVTGRPQLNCSSVFGLTPQELRYLKVFLEFQTHWPQIPEKMYYFIFTNSIGVCSNITRNPYYLCLGPCWQSKGPLFSLICKISAKNCHFPQNFLKYPYSAVLSLCKWKFLYVCKWNYLFVCLWRLKRLNKLWNRVILNFHNNINIIFRENFIKSARMVTMVSINTVIK